MQLANEKKKKSDDHLDSHRRIYQIPACISDKNAQQNRNREELP